MPMEDLVAWDMIRNANQQPHRNDQQEYNYQQDVIKKTQQASQDKVVDQGYTWDKVIGTFNDPDNVVLTAPVRSEAEPYQWTNYLEAQHDQGTDITTLPGVTVGDVLAVTTGGPKTTDPIYNDPAYLDQPYADHVGPAEVIAGDSSINDGILAASTLNKYRRAWDKANEAYGAALGDWRGQGIAGLQDQANWQKTQGVWNRLEDSRANDTGYGNNRFYARGEIYTYDPMQNGYIGAISGNLITDPGLGPAPNVGQPTGVAPERIDFFEPGSNADKWDQIINDPNNVNNPNYQG